GSIGNDAQITNNVLMGKFTVQQYGTGAVTFTGNTVYGPAGPTNLTLRDKPVPYSTYTWNNNIWHTKDYSAGAQGFNIIEAVPPNKSLSFTSWQVETGWD